MLTGDPRGKSVYLDKATINWVPIPGFKRLIVGAPEHLSIPYFMVAWRVHGVPAEVVRKLSYGRASFLARAGKAQV